MEMIQQIPAFNTDYFVIGEAVGVRNMVTGEEWDGLVIIRNKDRIGLVRVKYIQPMSGSSGYEPKTEYLYVKDFTEKNFEITKLNP